LSTKQKILFGSALILLFGLFLLVIYGDNGFFDLKRLHIEKEAMAAKNVEIEAENLKLYRKIKRLKHDPTYVEKVARQDLGMTGKDEMIFKFKKGSSGK